MNNNRGNADRLELSTSGDLTSAPSNWATHFYLY